MHTINNMAQRNNEKQLRKLREWRKGMEEKIYKTMSGSGALNIVVGVATLVAGITGGVLLIISGAKLLSSKSKILF